MAINFSNLFASDARKSKLNEFQDLDHLDGFQSLLFQPTYIIAKEMILLCFTLEKEPNMHRLYSV